MTDGEELLDYIELFHFVVRIIGEDLNFLDIFRNGLAKILRSRVERFISELPSTSDHKLNETSFIHSEAYNFLQTQITNQMKSIIDSIRRAKLWIPQGTGGQRSDPGAIISSVIKIEPEKIGITELSILRSIPTEKLTFSPDLTLYYISLLHATLAPDKFVRCFAYSLLRSAPQLFDPRHFFNVLKEALKFWGGPQINSPRSNLEIDPTITTTNNTNSEQISNQKNNVEVSFEFCASLALLLNSLSEIIHSVLDDDIEELLFSLIESIPKGPYFSTLIIFDSTFKWLIKTLPIESFKSVLNSSLELLETGSFAHLCLICRAVSLGIIGADILVPALKAALPTADKWPKAMLRETRLLFSGLVTRLPSTTITGILDILADQFNKVTGTDLQSKSESRIRVQVIVFSDFVINYMLNTTSPFHSSLFDSVQKLIIINNKNNSNSGSTVVNNSSNLNDIRKGFNRNNNTGGQSVKILPSTAMNGKRSALTNQNDAFVDNKSKDSEPLLKMFCALCANPVRFLESVEKAPDRSIFKLPFYASRTTLYTVLFEPNETPLLSGDEAIKSGENFIIHVKQLDEIDPNDFSASQIETCIRFSLWPRLFRNFLVNKVLYPSSSASSSFSSLQQQQQQLNLQIDSWMVSEEVKYSLLQIMLTMSIMESNREIIVSDFTEFLMPYITSESTKESSNNNSNATASESNSNENEKNDGVSEIENKDDSTHKKFDEHYECEYSEMIRQICSLITGKITSSFQILKEKIPSSASEIFVVGSKTMIGLSLLFEYTIWSEPQNLIGCFKRSRISPTEWFAFVASSLFVTIFNDPFVTFEPSLLKFIKESTLFFAWFAVVIVKKLSKYWLDLIADENFEDLMRMMLFPKISDGFSDEEIQYTIELHKKYQSVFDRFFNVINCE